MGPNHSRVRRDWGELPRESTSAARALPPVCPMADGGGTLGRWDWSSDNAGMKAIRLWYYMFLSKEKLDLIDRGKPPAPVEFSRV